MKNKSNTYQILSDFYCGNLILIQIIFNPDIYIGRLAPVVTVFVCQLFFLLLRKKSTLLAKILLTDPTVTTG